MVKASSRAETLPPSMMQSFGSVESSQSSSNETGAAPHQILERAPASPGSLGIAISEACFRHEAVGGLRTPSIRLRASSFEPRALATRLHFFRPIELPDARRFKKLSTRSRICRTPEFDPLHHGKVVVRKDHFAGGILAVDDSGASVRTTITEMCSVPASPLRKRSIFDTGRVPRSAGFANALNLNEGE